MCDICRSQLLPEIDKKAGWRPDRVVKWASKRGLEIDRSQLFRHYEHHLKESEKPKAVSCKTAKKCTSRPKTIKTARERKQPQFAGANRGEILLDSIIDRVYDNLIDDNYKLTIEQGFKAIEIKQKIAKTSQNDDLLLQLLSEIRNQELQATQN